MFKKVKLFLFENRTLRQTIAKNTFWLTVSNVGGRLLRAVIIIYAARVLGASGWGVFSYAIGLVAFLTILADFGINPVLIKETARTNDPVRRAKIISTSFFSKLALIFLGILIVIFIGPQLSRIEEAKTILPLISLVLLFDVLREFGSSIIKALEKMEVDAQLYLLTNLAVVAFGFTFLKVSPTVRSFSYAYVFGTALGASATFYVLRKQFQGLFSNFTAKLLKPIFTSAWPFAISAVLSGLMINTDILVIGFFKSAEDVGFYSAALRPIQLFYLLPSIIATSVFPAFARLAKKEDEKLRRVLERLMGLTFLISIPLAIFGVILGSEIMTFLFGQSYHGGVSSFQILTLTMLINFPAVILSNAIFAYDRQKSLAIFAAVGGISNLIFDFLLIPFFGIVGSAWATFGAQFLSNAYLWRTMKKINDFRILSSLKKIFIASLFMAGVVLLLKISDFHLLGILAFSSISYLIAILYLKEPLLKEIKLTLRPVTNGEIQKF
ncbi:MAG: flippase [Candidatus Liptonbacteria bacterium]|nr:flippase [Candidatus Liptonbacteria bacterium]